METTSTYIERRFRSYAVYVNMCRGIPAFSDGLKLGQRIAMWLMRNHSSGKIKTLALSGEMAASLLYIHGDASAQESISRLAAPFVNNVPLLKGEGNFGTLLVPSGWASARYTDIKQHPNLKEMLYSDIDILSMMDNYDGSRQMPVSFLPLVPLALLNGASGTGVGFACNIFPRSFQNLIKATVLAIEGKPIDPALLAPVYSFNNENTGTFVEYAKDGKPRWRFTGKFERVNASTIIVTELPSVPKYLLEQYKEFLNTLAEKDVINDYEDHSTKTIKIIVKFPRVVLKDKTDEQILELLGLVKIATENITVVGTDMDSLPNYVYDENHKYPNPVERFIREWVDWRIQFLEDRYRLLIDQTNAQINYLMVLKACFDDHLPKFFQSSKNRADLKERVLLIADDRNLFCNDIIQDKIVDRASYSWTVDSYEKILQDIAHQNEMLKDYTDLLNSPAKRRGVFKNEVSELKKVKA